MEVILKQDIEKLGKRGDCVRVSRGYARNYLVPRNLAVEATKKNIKIYEHEKLMHTLKIKKEEKEAKNLAEKLKDLSITIFVLTGENDKLYGSVTNHDVALALKKEGYEIDKRKIDLKEPIKKTGKYIIPITLLHDITTSIELWVIKKEEV